MRQRRQDAVAGGRSGGLAGSLAVLVAGALACLAVVVAAAVAGPVEIGEGALLDRLPQAGPADGQAESASEPGEATDQPPPAEETVLPVPVEVLVAILAVSLGLALLARSLLRAAPPPAAVDDLDPDADDGTGGDALADDAAGDARVDVAGVADAARSGAALLAGRSGAEAREAVVACWVALERAAAGPADRTRRAPAAAGRRRSLPPAARRPADSPTRFAARLVAAAPQVDSDGLDRLRLLYARTRFGHHEPSPAEVDEARAVLSRIVDALTTTTGGATSGATSGATATTTGGASVSTGTASS